MIIDPCRAAVFFSGPSSIWGAGAPDESWVGASWSFVGIMYRCHSLDPISAIQKYFIFNDFTEVVTKSPRTSFPRLILDAVCTSRETTGIDAFVISSGRRSRSYHDYLGRRGRDLGRPLCRHPSIGYPLVHPGMPGAPEYSHTPGQIRVYPGVPG